MHITITKTNELFDVEGVQVRKWLGVTEGGINVDVLVQSIRPQRDKDIPALTKELGMGEIKKQPEAKSIYDHSYDFDQGYDS